MNRVVVKMKLKAHYIKGRLQDPGKIHVSSDFPRSPTSRVQDERCLWRRWGRDKWQLSLIEISPSNHFDGTLKIIGWCFSSPVRCTGDCIFYFCVRAFN